MNTLDFVPYDDLEFNDIECDQNNAFYQYPCKIPGEDESLYPPGSEEYKKAR